MLPATLLGIGSLRRLEAPPTNGHHPLVLASTGFASCVQPPDIGMVPANRQQFIGVKSIHGRF